MALSVTDEQNLQIDVKRTCMDSIEKPAFILSVDSVIVDLNIPGGGLGRSLVMGQPCACESNLYRYLAYHV